MVSIMIAQFLNLENSIYFLNFILWIMAAIICNLAAFYLFFKIYSNRENIDKRNKENLITWGIFFLCQGFGHVLNVLWRFIIMDSEIYDLINSISMVVVLFGFVIKIFNVERSMKQSNLLNSRFSFTIIETIIVIVMIILNPLFIIVAGPVQILVIILLFSGYSLLPSIFFYIGKKSDGSVRRKSILIGVGLIFIILGTILQPHNIESYIINWPNNEMLTFASFVLTPIIVILGTLMIIYSYE